MYYTSCIYFYAVLDSLHATTANKSEIKYLLIDKSHNINIYCL